MSTFKRDAALLASTLSDFSVGPGSATLSLLPPVLGSLPLKLTTSKVAPVGSASVVSISPANNTPVPASGPSPIAAPDSSSRLGAVDAPPASATQAGASQPMPLTAARATNFLSSPAIVPAPGNLAAAPAAASPAVSAILKAATPAAPAPAPAPASQAQHPAQQNVTVGATAASVQIQSPAVKVSSVAAGSPSMPTSSAAVAPSATKAFYVAVNGNDHWSGRLAAPNAAGTDGPFATLAAAQQAMRASADTHTTYVEGGDYYLNQPLNLTGRDNGESWLAYQGQRAVLHGGQQITGWTSSATGIWTAKAPAGAFPSGGGTGDLFLNGVREAHARYPSAAPTNPVNGGWLAAGNSLTGQDTYRAFQFNPGDIPQLSSTSGLYASVFGQNGWSNSVLPVASINYKTDTITLASDADYQIGAGSRYFLFNAPSLLDTTGEWFYNPAGGTISFKAPAGFTGAGITAGSLDHIVSVANASNITIDGLTLTDTASNGSALTLNNATGVTVAGVTIANTGVGIYVSGSSTRDQIHGSEIRNTDQSGIRLDAGSSFVSVSGNWIHDIGQLNTTGSGIWFTGASDDSFTHNLIQNTAAFGIGDGSVIGKTDASFRNTISYNQISNANMQNADGGGIMLTGQQQSISNDVVSFNDIGHTLATGTADQSVLQFLPPADLVSFGIYLDDYASGVQVTNNVVHDGIGGIIVHSGWNNTIANNVLTGNSGLALEAQGANWQGPGTQPMANNAFVRNIVVLSQPGSTGAALVDAASGGASWDSNLYSGGALGSTAFMISAAQEHLYDLLHWQQQGVAFDPHSRVGDPGFAPGSVTPSGSAAASLGITPIVTSGIGLAGYQSQSVYDQFGVH